MTDNQLKNDINKKKVIVFCVVILLVVVIAVVIVKRKSQPSDSINDVFGIQTAEDIEEAVPIQNVIGSAVGRMNGENIAEESSGREELYQILNKAELVSDDRKEERYEINGFILWNPSIEIVTKQEDTMIIEVRMCSDAWFLW